MIERDYKIEEHEPEDLVGLATGCDLFIYAVGYESRSSFFREMLDGSDVDKVAISYNSVGKGQFDRNLELSEKRSDIRWAATRSSIFERLTDALSRLRANAGRPIKIAVDVSCLDRTVMASVFLCLFEWLRTGDEIVILYAPAEYQSPKLYLPPLKSFKPAIPELTAPVGSPYQRRFVIMGLGYEYGAALNVLNMLEPHRIHFFIPIGSDERYIEKVSEANFEFDFGLAEYELTRYHLSEPAALHATVRNLVHSYSHYGSIVMVPFGPKLLSAVCLLVACNNRQTVTFMRYSVESSDFFADVKASGEVCGFTATMA